MASEGKGRMASTTVVRRMQIREIEDDLSAMTVEYPEPKPQGRRRRRERRIGTSYVMVDTKSLALLELTGVEARVLHALIAFMDRDTSEVRMNGLLIAEYAHTHPSNVSRTLPALAARNIIFKLGPGMWRVSPWLAYAGEWRDWDAKAKHEVEPIWRRSPSGIVEG